MQGTADFHYHIAHPVFPHPDGLFEHTAAFDTALDMFDAHPSPRNRPVVCLLFGRQRFPTWLFCGLENLHTLQSEPLKAEVLQPLTPCRQRVRRHIGHALVVDAARRGLTEEHDAQCGIDQQEVFQPMPLFLAAITRFLFSRVCGARDGSLGAVVTQRGGTAGVGGCTASDDAEGRSASVPPRCWRKASTLRQGASPKVRKVFRSTGSKT
jgi:hypothetical protein